MTNLTPLLRLPRRALVDALASRFPAAVADGEIEAACGLVVRGGRQAALERLAAIDPVAYARSRNHVEGAVTMLSPWIRHGVLSLAEVRDAALARVAAPEQAAKLVSELGWRDYWRQVQAAVGERIRAPLEPSAAVARAGAAEALPADVLEARTGMACIDAFVRRLHGTGWLHNHERMWLASWLVHVRGIAWRTGADWFMRHLLDADVASNHLSWQWVAGTFSAKPYLFNRENLETFTSGRHCRECPVFGSCAVEGSYDELAARLFLPADTHAARPSLRIPPRPPAASPAPTPTRPLVWLTLDSAAATSPAAAESPGAPRLFVVDPGWLATERPALKRLVFLFECLAEVPGVEVIVGDPRDVVPARAAAHGCDGVAVAETSCPRDLAAVGVMRVGLPVVEVAWPRFCDRSQVRDLGRFSRYWQKVERSALRPT
jgi:deoxyribodipyrimidine photo-lyase